MCLTLKLVVLVSCLASVRPASGSLGSSCTTPNRESATCISIYDCRILLSAVKSRDPQQIEFLRKSQCGYDRNPLVCCGSKDHFTTSSSTAGANSVERTDTAITRTRTRTLRKDLIPDRSKCGFQISNKIFGGEEADLDEFPWVALLEYKTKNNSTRFACGGSVISKRYILTAAHCVTGQILTKLGPLVNVRLGEHDTRQEVDCFQSIITVCNKPPENFGVEETLFHPEYDNTNSNRYNDIALVRIDRDIRFTDYIRPICLPLPGESSAVGEKLVVAGWGKTEDAVDSPVKLKVEVPIAETSYCYSKFRSARIQLKNTQLCAGGQKGKDSCTGDSGGPLMRPTRDDPSQWYVEGIVSFGAMCGSSGWPAIYVKVAEYLDWIYSKVRD